MNKITKEQIQEARKIDGSIYGFFFGYCRLNNCCEDCDKIIRLGCKTKNLIEDLQTKRIKKICK